ncbi:hypothetical protein TGFOU_315660A [Toxoplasma gondii FOU]|uniref:Uncharacterized protein n=1 Tax=Toxoplasma gondii FOU TaxID=943167 RepID=A0A086LIA0_TOXGO|nr:hypothetical protein TGFOU_315660A [Toxoplasma gondii FOU]
MSLATALQRLGRFPQALRVLCDLYQREPFHPKLLSPRPAPLRLVVSPLSLPSPLPSGFLCTDSLTAAAALFVQLLFALFGSGVLTPEDELRLLRETKFDDSQLWARHLAVALLSAARDETPEAIWAQISSSSSSSSASSSSSSSSSASSSSSSSSSFSASPPRPPGLYAVPLAVGLDGRCLRVDDVLSYVEEMYPSRHIPPEFIYSRYITRLSSCACLTRDSLRDPLIPSHPLLLPLLLPSLLSPLLSSLSSLLSPLLSSHVPSLLSSLPSSLLSPLPSSLLSSLLSPLFSSLFSPLSPLLSSLLSPLSSPLFFTLFFSSSFSSLFFLRRLLPLCLLPVSPDEAHAFFCSQRQFNDSSDSGIPPKKRTSRLRPLHSCLRSGRFFSHCSRSRLLFEAARLLETSLAEAVYALPVFISCCVQLEKVAELHLLTERLEEALEGALADGERTTLTAALIHAVGSLPLLLRQLLLATHGATQKAQLEPEQSGQCTDTRAGAFRQSHRRQPPRDSLSVCVPGILWKKESFFFQIRN